MCVGYVGSKGRAPRVIEGYDGVIVCAKDIRRMLLNDCVIMGCLKDMIE